MIPTTRLKKITGLTMGTTTLKKRRIAPAPSMFAASSSVTGTLCSPARKMTNCGPMVQRSMKMKAGLARTGLNSHFCGGMPTMPMTSFKIPNSG
jgi:hypothetical protein